MRPGMRPSVQKGQLLHYKCGCQGLVPGLLLACTLGRSRSTGPLRHTGINITSLRPLQPRLYGARERGAAQHVS